MINLDVNWGESGPTVLSLLICGHILGDFVFQSQRLANAKKNSKPKLALHALQIGLVQGAVLLPFYWNLRGLFLVAGIGLAHYLIDWVKIAMEQKGASPRWFLLDQAAHLVVLWGVWRMWSFPDASSRPDWLGIGAAVVAAVAFNANGAASLVACTLGSLDPHEGGDAVSGPKGAGRLIGILERWMILGLVAVGQWGAVGLVLTAKSIARFKRMDEQAFAEVYLVGTMTSVMIAMLTGGLLAALFHMA